MAAVQLLSRDAFRHEYRHTTRADVAIALEVAITPAEVDAAAHLSLALFGVAGTLEAFTEHGRAWVPLHAAVMEARARVHGFPESSYQSREDGERAGELARQQAIRHRRDIYAEREARIARIGISNAKPLPEKRTGR